MKKLITSQGFTLIELLVVVSLIGILATLVLANLNAARERGRDAARKSDLKNISTALRLYYNDYGKFPDSSTTKEIVGCGPTGTTTCAWGDPFIAGTQTYMTTLPKDPLTDVSYQYEQIDLDNFTLKACLENKSDEKAVLDPTASWCPSEVVYTLQQ